MEFSLLYIANILLGVANLVLGFLIFIKSKKRHDSRFFFLLTVATSLWIFGLIIFSISNSYLLASVAAHIYYAAAATIAYSLFYFALIFPEGKFKLSKIRDGLLGIAHAAILIISLSPKILFEKIILADPNIIELKPAYNLYSLYFLVLGAITFYIFIKRFKKSKGIERIQFKYALLGISLAYIFGIIFNLLLPWSGDYTKILIGPMFTVAMVVLFAYAIAKHGLMNVRLIATELFTILTIFVFLVNIFSFNNLQELIFNIGLFVLVTIFGILLVRGTIREINTLRELSEKKSEFLSIASHQLRTPVTIMKGYLSMMREGSFGKLAEKQLTVVNKAYKTNEDMLGLINDFLNLSRAEKGTLEYLFAKRDMVAIINGIVTGLKPSAEMKNITLNWSRPAESVFAYVDQTKITQVISNFIDNAIKYTPEGGGISVNIEKEGPFDKTVKVYVKDNGIGIKEEEKENIFGSFERGETGKKVNATGTGLGLYVAKMIIEGHNGKIWAESEGEGKGSTFIIELPVKQPKKEKI